MDAEKPKLDKYDADLLASLKHRLSKAKDDPEKVALIRDVRFAAAILKLIEAL